eukprot:scaffold54120_cov51-Phaeocystis_antarctica.AAC.1
MASVWVVLYHATAPLDGPRRRYGLAEPGDAEEAEPKDDDEHGDARDRKVAHDHCRLRLLCGAGAVVAAGDELVDGDHDETHEHDGAVARDEEVVHPGEVVDLRHPLDEHELQCDHGEDHRHHQVDPRVHRVAVQVEVGVGHGHHRHQREADARNVGLRAARHLELHDEARPRLIGAAVILVFLRHGPLVIDVPRRVGLEVVGVAVRVLKVKMHPLVQLALERDTEDVLVVREPAEVEDGGEGHGDALPSDDDAIARDDGGVNLLTVLALPRAAREAQVGHPDLPLWHVKLILERVGLAGARLEGEAGVEPLRRELRVYEEACLLSIDLGHAPRQQLDLHEGRHRAVERVQRAHALHVALGRLEDARGEDAGRIHLRHGDPIHHVRRRRRPLGRARRRRRQGGQRWRLRWLWRLGWRRCGRHGGQGA